MTAILIEAFWKSAVVLGIALLAAGLLRKRSADLRRVILTTAILALFAMAAALFALPRWTAEIPSIPPPPVVIAPVSQFQLATTAIAIPFAKPQPVQPARRTPDILAVLWLAIATLLLARFFTSLYSLRRLRRASLQIGTTHHVPILQSDAASAPVTWGVLHPVILVPANFGQLPEENRDAILCHELAHIHSHDFLLRNLAEIARALLWFQPLIWIARRQLREAQELACDDRVLDTGASPSSYAKLLLDWSAGPEIAVGMAHRSCLKKRLYALLDQNAARSRVSSITMVAASLVALTTSIPLAAITFTETIPNPLVITLRTPAAPAMEPIAQHSQPRIQLAQTLPAKPAAPASTTAALAVPSSDLTASAFLVIFDVQVTDKTTHAAISNLGVNDFTLTEDGVPQAIRFCEFFQLDGATPANSYYALGYYTTNTSADTHYRVVKVHLNNQSLAANATLDFRPGYYGEKAPSLATVTPTDDGRFHGEFGAATNLPAGVTPPVLTYRIDPEYSTQARKAKYSGTVTLSVLVDETGKVTAVNVVRALGMGLDEKAMEAVRQWRFNPATQNGKPVAAQVPVSVNFRLL